MGFGPCGSENTRSTRRVLTTLQTSYVLRMRFHFPRTRENDQPGFLFIVTKTSADCSRANTGRLTESLRIGRPILCVLQAMDELFQLLIWAFFDIVVEAEFFGSDDIHNRPPLPNIR